MSREKRLAELHDATRKLITAESRAEIHDLAIATVDRVLGFGTCSIRRADESDRTLELVARSEASRRAVGALPTYDLDGDSAAARAYRTGDAVLDEHGGDEEYGRDPLVASLYVPLDGYGILSVGTQSGTFAETDVQLVEILAANIAAALERTSRGRAVRRLHRAARNLSRKETPEEIAEVAVEAAREIIGMDLTTVLLREGSDELVPVAYTDGVADVVGEPPPLDVDEGVIGRTYQQGEVELHDDVREDPAVVNPETPLRSELTLPLADHGVLVCDSTEVEEFDETDLVLARILAANVEVALDGAERERLLRERAEEIRQQNERLESFASVVSHDLKGPLNVAEGYLDLLAEECDSEHVATVAEAHERMDSLIEDVLTLARRGETIGETGPVELSAAVTEAWNGVDAPEATLETGSLPRITADGARLRELLVNLFRNSVKHAGPEVTVEVGGFPDGFYVADDGPGIPPDDREAVFEPGYSTAEEGTGLGLQIVRTIAEGHGWTVRAVDSDARGARFELRGVDVLD